MPNMNALPSILKNIKSRLNCCDEQTNEFSKTFQCPTFHEGTGDQKLTYPSFDDVYIAKNINFCIRALADGIGVV